MRENHLKKMLLRGESAVGSFMKLTDPAVPELLALAGFDFFVLDTEHVAMDREQLTNIVRAADAAGITPIVRVRENQQVEILQNLDLGWAGVEVPNVDTPQAARLPPDPPAAFSSRARFSRSRWFPGSSSRARRASPAAWRQSPVW